MNTLIPKNKGLILFDGYCNLCSCSVRFILKRDKTNFFLLSNLQSEKAKAVLSSFQLPENYDKSVILILDNTIWFESDAVLKIVSKLNGFWPILRFFKIIPKPLRDFVYQLISRYRFKLFRKRTECYLGEKNDSGKFII
ncbi:MAG: hypothetical protein A2X13_03570 [Bacteroidetes bacterium GWC2_33_15]|nr:MAG: hypothetical protein A2X10_13185 [Bacteroidetes bacterium GWA2_33_15]OFX51688.1 MAG: hypothetical protein A2X13_03570 [Bacteroidetes bacterium GWC2_33_15]OFX66250.1 MAG: hypothetical protein A2X15_14375 [Bacteroidetes bacterium GWB2_32_14]OFX66988.1 MAG: hypothetical protein A2X14_00730 [Bacteroidetes bacterium GWD2_33_33]HAN17686.1 thiol-disulfide oxidoreductase [Bacteroidales bacterium]